MSNVRFISDLHFGHKFMASHRGFNDVFEHDEHIVDYWNRNVHPKDLTFIVGDITMETDKWYFYLDQLKGRKVVIGGNHDLRKHSAELLTHVESIIGVLDYKGYCITHIPIHPIELYDNNYKTKYRGNLYGHTHSKIIDDPYYYTLDAKALNYIPRTIDQLILRQDQIFKEGKLIEDAMMQPWI